MPTGQTLTVSDEKTLLSGYLHAELLGFLLTGIFWTGYLWNLFRELSFYILNLTGMYTPLYFGTMYIYSETIFSKTI